MPAAKSRRGSDPAVVEPREAAARGSAGFACDFCGAAYPNVQRRRLIWETKADGDFILADLCPHCTSSSDRLLKAFAGRDPHSLRLSTQSAAQKTGVPVLHRASGALARAAIYALIVLATFFVVTLLATRH